MKAKKECILLVFCAVCNKKVTAGPEHIKSQKHLNNLKVLKHDREIFAEGIAELKQQRAQK